MRLIICVLLLTFSSLATAQTDNGLTTAEVVEHLDANEAMLASAYELWITILFGWLTASYLVGHKLTQAQFWMAVISYSLVYMTLVVKILVLSLANLQWMEQINFYYLPTVSDYWVVAWRVGLPLFLFIVSLYFAHSIRRGKNQAQIAID